jgi:hypothetical protein
VAKESIIIRFNSIRMAHRLVHRGTLLCSI